MKINNINFKQLFNNKKTLTLLLVGVLSIISISRISYAYLDDDTNALRAEVTPVGIKLGDLDFKGDNLLFSGRAGTNVTSLITVTNNSSKTIKYGLNVVVNSSTIKSTDKNGGDVLVTAALENENMGCNPYFKENYIDAVSNRWTKPVVEAKCSIKPGESHTYRLKAEYKKTSKNSSNEGFFDSYIEAVMPN